MTLRPDFTEAALEEELGELALRALREWLSSENYREREVWYRCFEDTFIGRTLKEREEDWHYKGPLTTKALLKLRGDLADVWVRKGWTMKEQPRLGRRRKTEYDEETLKKARHVYGDGNQGYVSDATWRWAQAVLGETSNQNPVYFVVVSPKVHEELFRRLEPEELEGLTREEVAELLDLPKKFANSFVRYLVQHHDWELATTKVERSTRRVLRRTTQ